MKIREGKIPTGKGMFLWMLYRLAGGDMVLLAETLKKEGYNWVCVKVVEGRLIFNPLPRNKEVPSQQELLAVLAPALKERGIELHLWGWYYGSTYGLIDQTTIEAQNTLDQIEKWRPLSFQFNFEHWWKRIKSRSRAVSLLEKVINGMRATNDTIPDIPIAVSSYKFPSYHQELPWDIFARYVDYWCPQVYWEQAHNPKSQLERSVKEYLGLAKLPIVPAGSAYSSSDGTWSPTVDDIEEFNLAVVEMGLPAIYWWEYEYIERNQAWREEIAIHDWEFPTPPPPPPPPGHVCPLPDLKSDILEVLNRY